MLCKSANQRGWRKKAVSVTLSALLCLAVAVGVSGCSGLESVSQSVDPVPFTYYQQQTLSNVADHRQFQQVEHQNELLWNGPQEYRPPTLLTGARPAKGILLVHGLGDSPWSFTDVAQVLSQQGFLVRTVLLPGHGTTPNDMLEVTAEQWQAVVHQQAKQLEMDVDGPVYMGGFSTGANLILDYAYQHPSIAGLALFSPGFKSRLPFQWAVPALSKVKPWLITPDNDVALQSPVRYMMVPTNGFAQYYRTSLLAQKLLEKPYAKPVIMVASEHDSVIDTRYLLSVFQRSFTHPDSRFIWYGNAPEEIQASARLLVRSDRIEPQRISQFSHMGVLFSPTNQLYGRQGELRICLNSMDDEERRACEAGAELWFSAWGYQEKGKVHARLTFNPYFAWQNRIMLTVLGS